MSARASTSASTARLLRLQIAGGTEERAALGVAVTERELPGDAEVEELDGAGSVVG